MMKTEYHLQEVTQALREIEKIKGKERAILLEKIARCETAHFTSKQWKLTKSFGMEQGKWANLDESKMKTIVMNDNILTGAKKSRVFLVWDNVLDFCLYFSDYIDRHKGNYARWNRTTEDGQKKYRDKIEQIRNKIII